MARNRAGGEPQAALKWMTRARCLLQNFKVGHYRLLGRGELNRHDRIALEYRIVQLPHIRQRASKAGISWITCSESPTWRVDWGEDNETPCQA